MTADGSPVDVSVTIDGDILRITPTDTLPYGAECRLTIPAESVADLLGNPLSVPYELTFTTAGMPDTSPPVLSSAVPVHGTDNVRVNVPVMLVFNESIMQGPSFGAIQITADGVPVGITKSIQGRALVLTPVSRLPYGTEIIVSVPLGAIQDLVGNEPATGLSLSFTTELARETIPPVITDTYPADGDPEADPAAELYIVFDEGIIPGINYDDIELKATAGDGSVIGISKSIAGNTLVITPDSPMPFYSDMTLTIPAGAVCDLFGNPFESGRILSFTTSFIPDVIPPALISTNPADGATGISPGVHITVTFDEVLFRGDAFDLISLTDSGLHEVSTTASFADTTLTIVPGAALNYGTTYRLTLPVGVVTDEAGNPQDEISISFTTVQPWTPPPPPPPDTPPSSSGGSGRDQIIITEDDIEEESESVSVTEDDLQNGILVTSGALQKLADEGGVLEIDLPGCTLRIDGSDAVRILEETGEDGLLIGAPDEELDEPELPDYLAPVGDPINISTSANGTLVIPFEGIEDPWLLQVYVNTGTEWVLVGGRIDPESGTIEVPVGEGVQYRLMQYTGEFGDTGGHWAEDEVAIMAARLIALGYPDGGFRPDNNVLRSEMLSFLSRTLSYVGYTHEAGDSGEPGETDESAGFSDISPDDWFAEQLGNVTGAGLMLGYPDGTFRPEEPMTREQAASVVLRLLELIGASLPEVSDNDVLDSYSDSGELSEWARQAMVLAVSMGIMQGSGSRLRPHDPITRAELVTIIRRVLDIAGILQV
jgi:hypothetical protein